MHVFSVFNCGLFLCVQTFKNSSLTLEQVQARSMKEGGHGELLTSGSALNFPSSRL